MGCARLRGGDSTSGLRAVATNRQPSTSEVAKKSIGGGGLRTGLWVRLGRLRETTRDAWLLTPWGADHVVLPPVGSRAMRSGFDPISSRRAGSCGGRLFIRAELETMHDTHPPPGA